MATEAPRTRLIAGLWFVAAALAMAAAGIPYFKSGETNWGVGAGGFFCLIMGISALGRKPPTPPAG